MDQRRATVLQAVVEHFIENAQPVGSTAVLEMTHLDVSPATVRNELAALEAGGYLTQPHTSAGRVPTEAGYRHFVDALGPGSLDNTEVRQVRAFFAHAQGQLEELLADTSRLLADLTEYAAMVVAPRHDQDSIRSAQLVDLGGGRLLVVLVMSSGAVDRTYVDVYSNRELADAARGPAVGAASAVLADALVGRARLRSQEVLETGDATTDALVKAAIAALNDDPPAPSELYVGGTAKITEQFEAASSLRSVLTVLEEQLMVVTLLRSLVDRGLSVAIGSETGMKPLADCSVVVAPYQVDGRTVGSVGLLGPTRMDYSKALAAVHTVSRRLSASLGDGESDRSSARAGSTAHRQAQSRQARPGQTQPRHR
ncbi:heat-inducible transcriptional repressor HrcA [Candidatus Poriferisodalis sp.]|uniref:heat-inducible transcriptional repressor HrcA n=1 Tax=Candidatus Poriferisodalis sp. TaxID=3101277 RepID=UPI003B027551